MALPFLNNGAKKKRDDILAIDLGSRATKAIHVQRRGQGLALCSYALLDAPIFDKTVSAELLMEHLKAVVSALNAKTKAVALTVGVGDALVRTVEMPTMPLDDLRLVLKHNSRNYLQQDMSNYVFDCHVIGGGINKPSGGKGAANLQKQKVLVAG